MKVNGQSANNNRVMITGVNLLELVGVNPTLEVLRGWGYPFKQEQIYQTIDQNGRKIVNLDLYFKIHTDLTDKDLYTSYRFRLVNEERPESKTGKVEIINSRGQTAWHEPNAVPTDFGDYRRTFVGESDLQTFLFAFFGLNPTNKEHTVMLENREALWNGNVAEIQKVIKDFPDNRVKDMLGVKNGYQVMSGNFVGASYQPSNGCFFSRSVLGLTKDGKPTGYGFSADFMNDFKPQIYVPTVDVNSPTVQTKTEVVKNDLPF